MGLFFAKDWVVITAELICVKDNTRFGMEARGWVFVLWPPSLYQLRWGYLQDWKRGVRDIFLLTSHFYEYLYCESSKRRNRVVWTS